MGAGLGGIVASRRPRIQHGFVQRGGKERRGVQIQPARAIGLPELGALCSLVDGDEAKDHLVIKRGSNALEYRKGVTLVVGILQTCNGRLLSADELGGLCLGLEAPERMTKVYAGAVFADGKLVTD